MSRGSWVAFISWRSNWTCLPSLWYTSHLKQSSPSISHGRQRCSNQKQIQSYKPFLNLSLFIYLNCPLAKASHIVKNRMRLMWYHIWGLDTRRNEEQGFLVKYSKIKNYFVNSTPFHISFIIRDTSFHNSPQMFYFRNRHVTHWIDLFSCFFMILSNDILKDIF